MQHACSTRLLVEVPFTSADVALLERAHSLWNHYLPCTTSSSQLSCVSLLNLFNGRCRSAESIDACEHAEHLARTSGPVRDCFADVRVQDARLSGRADTYDKHRRSAAWTMGPNNLFHRAVASARQQGFTHMLQLEPDVIPFRAGWADRAQRLAELSDAWIIGSALQANCTIDDMVST